MLRCHPTARYYSGEQAGGEFVIATGDEDEKMMETIEAFNNMEVDALWEHVCRHRYLSYGGWLTKALLPKEMMAGFMAQDLIPLQWEVMSVIPVQAKGEQQRASLAGQPRENLHERWFCGR
ncbi:MAG: hypothetical protein U5J95_03580 [Balneolaceae bacterium]|nr:hypothetical protein [Balneolaceae bacterium]